MTPSGAGDAPPVRVRMYRHGLGDCFLLTFGAGEAARHMLIDCGTLGGTTNPANKISKVVADIVAATGNRLTVLVATHEHKDHLSGFNSEREAYAGMKVDHVWLAWTENPDDDDAKGLKIYKDDLGVALGAAISAAPPERAKNQKMATSQQSAVAAANAARDILGFAGDPSALGASDFAKTIDAAMKFVRDELGVKPSYQTPGEGPIELPEIPGFRFYVLGPPKKKELLAEMGGDESQHLYSLRAAGVAHAGLTKLSPSEVDRCELEMAFDPSYRVREGKRGSRLYPGYHARQNDWRRIDYDWMSGVADLALQLDNLTNNTSLALAIERIADGRVLLFPADAQEGNWLSWDSLRWTVADGGGSARTVTPLELVRNTVFYKVGHHGSHNATRKDQGLEEMSRQFPTSELTAFIPVDRAVALQRHPKKSWRMPARALYRRLLEKCEGRVVRSDVGWASAAGGSATEAELAGLATDAQWSKWRQSQDRAKQAGDVTVDALFVDYFLR